MMSALLVYSQRRLHQNALKPKAMQGFSLVELIVAVAILGILTAVAIPAFTETILSFKLRSYANDFVGHAYLARGEAIKNNAPVTICVSTNGTSCSTTDGWESGWIILSGTTVVQRHEALATGYKIIEEAGTTSLIFQPTGIGATQATLTICKATPTAGSQERVVRISTTGRPSVSKTNAGTCA